MKREGIFKDKSGQFYLVAAIIISVIVIGFISMSNYSIRKETINIQDVGQELSIESEKVLDYATYNRQNENQAMEEFANYYIDYVREGEESYFLFGNSEMITVVGHTDEDKTINVDYGAGQGSMEINEGQTLSQDFFSPSDEVIITIDGKDYEFELKSGENFYFIIFESSEGEEHVIRN